MGELKEVIEKNVSEATDKMSAIEEIREILHELSPLKEQPVDIVRWIPIEKIESNEYNPNTVAKPELTLLYKSIKHDHFTQPVVAIYDNDRDKYVIVDGFHRYFVAKAFKDIYDCCNGLLPIVVIEKDINDRMASTIRHNRARGKHVISGMSSMVFKMLENGWKDAEICNELGMEAEELLKLKHITGFSKLFENAEYKKAWMTKRQIRIKMEWEKKQRNSDEISRAS